MADCVARRLVARDDEKDEERTKLLVGQLFAVERRIDKRRRQIVRRVLTSVRAKLLDHLREFGPGSEQRRRDVRALGHVLGIACAKDDIRTREDRLVCLLYTSD